MKKILILSLAVAAMLFSSCKGKYDALLQSSDIPAKYAAAFKYYYAKKPNYKKSAELFESLSMLTGGMPMDDTVRFYWAMSNYKYKDFVTAEANFRSFTDFYPRSSFTSTARFLRLDCLYRATYRFELDQAPTNLAIMAISEYMIEFPESDKIDDCKKMMRELQDRLDTKEFAAAYLYYKMEDYIAAKTSLKNILKDHSENIHREEVLFYIAKSCYKYAQLSVTQKQKERYMEFVDAYYNFISELPDSRHRAELDKLYARTQTILGRQGAVLTGKELREDKAIDKQIEKEMTKEEKEVGKKAQKLKKSKERSWQKVKSMEDHKEAENAKGSKAGK